MKIDKQRRQKLVGAAVRAARKARGWTIADAVQRADLSHKTWHRVEDGGGSYPRTYRSMAEALDLDPGAIMDALYGEEGPAKLASELGVYLPAFPPSRQRRAAPRPSTPRDVVVPTQRAVRDPVAAELATRLLVRIGETECRTGAQRLAMKALHGLLMELHGR